MKRLKSAFEGLSWLDGMIMVGIGVFVVVLGLAALLDPRL